MDASEGEKYIAQTCTIYFEIELNKAFGKDGWKFDCEKFYEYWDLSNFPKLVSVDVRDKKDNSIIGTVFIHSQPIIVENRFERYIDMKPDKIEIQTLEVINDD